MASTSEMNEKQWRVNELLDRTGNDALLLLGSDNFAWFTCGGSDFVNIATDGGVGALLIHRDRKTLITNNVERPRLLEEEMGGQGFAIEAPLWTEDAVDPVVARHRRGGADHLRPSLQCRHGEAGGGHGAATVADGGRGGALSRAGQRRRRGDQ